MPSFGSRWIHQWWACECLFERQDNALSFLSNDPKVSGWSFLNVLLGGEERHAWLCTNRLKVLHGPTYKGCSVCVLEFCHICRRFGGAFRQFKAAGTDIVSQVVSRLSKVLALLQHQRDYCSVQYLQYAASLVNVVRWLFREDDNIVNKEPNATTQRQ